MRIDQPRLRDFAERYTAAWCGNDPTGVAAFYSPHGSLRVNSAAPAVGRNAIAEVARGFMTTFPDLKLTMDDLIIEDAHAVYHWTFAGTNTGPAGTGQRVLFSGYEIWEWRGRDDRGVSRPL